MMRQAVLDDPALDILRAAVEAEGRHLQHREARVVGQDDGLGRLASAR